MRELQRKLDHDAKLQQFFEIKGQLRTNADLEIRETNKKLQIQKQLENLLEDYDRILDSIQVCVNFFFQYFHLSNPKYVLCIDNYGMYNDFQP